MQKNLQQLKRDEFFLNKYQTSLNSFELVYRSLVNSLIRSNSYFFLNPNFEQLLIEFYDKMKKQNR
jgi:hypothetical protein